MNKIYFFAITTIITGTSTARVDAVSAPDIVPLQITYTNNVSPLKVRESCV